MFENGDAVIPLAVPNLAGKEAEYLQQCVDTTFVSSVGSFVDRFESMVAEAAAAKQAVATSAGTTGLHAALVACGVEHGDLVILQSLTFIASANAIAACGAMPWLFDIDADSWTLDPKQLAEILRKETHRNSDGIFIHSKTGRRVSAILPVFTLGMPADMDAIAAIASEFKLPIVIDAAAALGAKYKNTEIGNLKFDLAVFSFNGNKTVTCGGGGAVVGNDPDQVSFVRHLTTTARASTGYDHDMVGFNYRMTNLQAAVGCAQMENLNTFLQKKKFIREHYEREFADLEGISFYPSPEWSNSADWFSGFVLGEQDPLHFRQTMRDNGIDARSFWKPMHLQKPYLSAPATPQPVSETLWQRIITLPCSTNITDQDLDRVVSTVHHCLIKNC